MLEQLALSFIQSGGRAVNATFLLTGVSGFVLAVFTGTKTIDLSRSRYFFFLMSALLLSAFVGTTTSHMPAAMAGGYAWLIVGVSLLNVLGTGYVMGLLSLWRAVDINDKRWPALLGLVPLAGLYLVLAPPPRAARTRTPAMVTAALVIGGVVAGVAAGMVSRSSNGPTVPSAAIVLGTGPSISSSDLVANPRPSQPTDTQDELGISLVAAAGTNDVAAITALLVGGAQIDYSLLQRTPLIVAISERNEEAVAVLLEAGADPNFVSTYDWRPIHYAINADSASTQIIRQLIAHGGDPDARTNLGITPLHRAAAFCHADAVRLLADMSADATLVDNKGRTAAQRSALSGCPDLASPLLK